MNPREKARRHSPGGRNSAVTTASDVVSHVRISEIYRALGGIEPHRTGRDAWRGPAFWRGGEGLNVSMNDTRGVWHDFAADEGGGVLDLVVRIRSGSRADALRWVADLTGLPIDDTPLSPMERKRWAAERRDLPTAQYWRRSAISMAEDLIATLKAGMFDRTLPQPEIGELCHLETLLSVLRRSDRATLIEEYRWWLAHYPGTTAAMIHSAKARGRTERRALLAYLRLTDPEGRAA
jgi:hypothetical protein